MTRPDVGAMRALLAKVKAATGPDREIEARIHHALFPEQEVLLDAGVVFGPGQKRPATYGPLREFPIDGWQDYEAVAGAIFAGAYTGSIDAAVALFKRILPGWSYCIRESGFGGGDATIHNPMWQPAPGYDTRFDHSAGPGLALIGATFTALIAAEDRHG